MTNCQICNGTNAQQTCSQCNKKFCPSCRSANSGGRPICKNCAGDSKKSHK